VSAGTLAALLLLLLFELADADFIGGSDEVDDADFDKPIVLFPEGVKTGALIFMPPRLCFEGSQRCSSSKCYDISLNDEVNG
jgi:hypothetical protein